MAGYCIGPQTAVASSGLEDLAHRRIGERGRDLREHLQVLVDAVRVPDRRKFRGNLGVYNSESRPRYQFTRNHLIYPNIL